MKSRLECDFGRERNIGPTARFGRGESGVRGRRAVVAFRNAAVGCGFQTPEFQRERSARSTPVGAVTKGETRGPDVVRAAAGVHLGWRSKLNSFGPASVTSRVIVPSE